MPADLRSDVTERIRDLIEHDSQFLAGEDPVKIEDLSGLEGFCHLFCNCIFCVAFPLYLMSICFTVELRTTVIMEAFGKMIAEIKNPGVQFYFKPCCTKKH